MDIVYFEAKLICDFFKEKNIDNIEFLFSRNNLLKVTKTSFSIMHQEINQCIVFDFETETVLIEKYFIDKEMFLIEVISKVRSKYITKKSGEIYRIVNKKNDMCYIGKTNGTSSLRWKTHVYGYENSEIAKAIKEFGVSNFYFEVLEEVEISLDGIEDSKSALSKAERKWMHYFDSINKGYNARI